MEISQDSTISFSSKISVDLGLKENNVRFFFLNQTFLSEQAVMSLCSDKFRWLVRKGEVHAASVNAILQFSRVVIG